MSDQINEHIGKAGAYTSLAASRSVAGDQAGARVNIVKALVEVGGAIKSIQDAGAYAALQRGDFEAALRAVGGDQTRLDQLVADSLDQQMAGAGLLVMTTHQ